MFAFAVLTFLPAAGAFPAQEGPAIRGRTSNDAGAVFQFDASAPVARGSDITIRCIEACKHGLPAYREHVDVSPTYVMVPKDGSTRFISVWTTGSAYLVMVHEVGGPKVTKVLEHGSRIPPSSTGIDDQGNEFFTLCDEDHGCSEYHWRAGLYEATARQDYHWAK
jgi:hypothetical protein